MTEELLRKLQIMEGEYRYHAEKVANMFTMDSIPTKQHPDLKRHLEEMHKIVGEVYALRAIAREYEKKVLGKDMG